MARVLIAGGSGAAGTRLAAALASRKHEGVIAARSAGVDTASGRGLAEAMRGVEVVVDVTNARSRSREEVADFFQTSARNLIDAGRHTVRHYIVLSVVGAHRMAGSAHMAGKLAQEGEVAGAGVPFTILRATQFFEFVAGFGDIFGTDNGVRVPDANMQPMAIDDVAKALAMIVDRAPADRILEIGGPRAMPIREAVARILVWRGDQRPVTSSSDVLYFGAALEKNTLVPESDAMWGATTLEDWLNRQH